MTLLSALGCAALAVVVGLSLPAVLARLPEPDTSAGKLPYTALATPANRWTVGIATFVALTVSVTVMPWPMWLILVPLGSAGIVLAVIDAHTTYLPRHVVWAAGVALIGCVAVAAAAQSRIVIVPLAATGALILGGLLWCLWRFTGGIGFGDVRLGFLVGGSVGAFGPSAVMTAAFLGSLIGLAWGLAQRTADRRAGRTPGPFAYGPSLVAGPYAWMVWSLLPGGTVTTIT